MNNFTKKEMYLEGTKYIIKTKKVNFDESIEFTKLDLSANCRFTKLLKGGIKLPFM